jgi:tetratricopeptide (TPR) repeat protein
VSAAAALAQGSELLAGGRFHEALAVFTQALRAQPASVEARIGLARACAGTGDALTAAAWLSDAARMAPDNAQAVQLLAELLLGQKQYAQALPLFERLVTGFGAANRANLLHLGFCFEQTGDIDHAARRYREAIALDPDFLEAHVDLAGVLWRLEDFEGSLAHAKRAVEIAPDHPYAVRILGTALLNLNRLQEAEPLLRRALQLQPGFALAELDLAFALLLAGKLEEGWRMYERRWQDRQRLPRPAFYVAEREWQGPQQHPLHGRSIAVYAEQGLGDVIQCLRYITRLQAEGATVRCVVQPELVPLVEASFDGVECWQPGRKLEAYYHVAAMELPLRYGTSTLEAIPAQVPYLKAPADRVTHWRERMQPWAGDFKLGIAWSGSMQQVNNRNRAVPLSLLQPLTEMSGVRCFSLQKGEAGPSTNVKIDAGKLVDLTSEWRDFGDSAAMLEQLDLVITVDTAIAHLAGALARPVWAMLPPNADWRWLLEREDSPWYAGMRLFRRGFEELREEQVARVVDGLRSLLQERG